MQGGAGSDTFVLGASEYAGTVTDAHGNVTMIRDYVVERMILIFQHLVKL